MARTAPAPVITHLPEIGVTVISRWLFNCYLIHDGGDGRPLVVDLGLPSQVPLLAAELGRSGAALTDLGAAVATHGHADHLGGLPTLREQARPPIHLPATLRAMRDGHVGLRTPGPRQVAQILPVMADQPFDLGALRELAPVGKVVGYDARSVKLPFEPTGWLADGDTLPGLPDWEVVHAPGHTDDSSCLYHRPTRTLLSGDSVLSVGGRAWFNPEFVDSERSAATDERLRTLPVDHLLPGHGRVVTGTDVLADALSCHDRPADGGKVRALRKILHSHRHP